jgi:transposase
MKEKGKIVGRRQYDDAFKKDVVNMVVHQGRNVQEVSESLGIKANMVHRWKREYLDSSASTNSSAAPIGDVLSLQKRIRDLEMERDILKKALGIFSQKN